MIQTLDAQFELCNMQGLYEKGFDYLEYMASDDEQSFVMCAMEKYPKNDAIQKCGLDILDMMNITDLDRAVTIVLGLIQRDGMRVDVVQFAHEFIDKTIYIGPCFELLTKSRIREMTDALSKCKIKYNRTMW